MCRSMFPNATFLPRNRVHSDPNKRPARIGAARARRLRAELRIVATRLSYFARSALRGFCDTYLLP